MNRSKSKQNQKRNYGKDQDDEVDDGFYEVECILDMKTDKGLKLYKVKWKGYPMDACTWEPKIALRNIKAVVANFEANYDKNSKNSKNIKSVKNDIKNDVKSDSTIDSKNDSNCESKNDSKCDSKNDNKNDSNSK